KFPAFRSHQVMDILVRDFELGNSFCVRFNLIHIIKKQEAAVSQQEVLIQRKYVVLKEVGGEVVIGKFFLFHKNGFSNRTQGVELVLPDNVGQLNRSFLVQVIVPEGRAVVA